MVERPSGEMVAAALSKTFAFSTAHEDHLILAEEVRWLRDELWLLEKREPTEENVNDLLDRWDVTHEPLKKEIFGSMLWQLFSKNKQQQTRIRELEAADEQD